MKNQISSPPISSSTSPSQSSPPISSLKSPPKSPLALYIHFPYCAALCPYCDFNVHIKKTLSDEDFIQAIKAELVLLQKHLSPRFLTSLFFGGGTPSLMSAVMVSHVIDLCERFFPFDKNIEISLEANPENADRQRLKDFHKAGISRLSLGVQSLDDDALRFLGRKHSALKAKHAISDGRDIFPQMSFDLIYARPHQKLAQWEKELKDALAFKPHHISLYQLSAPPKTAFGRKMKAGYLSLPKEEESAVFYQASAVICAQNELARYEISNHAIKGFESRHNLSYWRYHDYVGLGAGAHGRVHLANGDFVSTHNLDHPAQWAYSAHHQPFAKHFHSAILDERIILEEMVIMGLRLSEGIALSRLKKYKRRLNQHQIDELCAQGFLSIAQERLATTKKGALVLDFLIPQLLQ